MLQKIQILPGFNKQVTETGGEGQWVGGDYVRFRYGTPEKIGGWAQLGDSLLMNVIKRNGKNIPGIIMEQGRIHQNLQKNLMLCPVPRNNRIK